MTDLQPLRDLPATQGFVQDQIQDLKSEMNQRFGAIDKRLDSHDEKFKSHEEEFRSIDRRFDQVDTKLVEIQGQVSRIGVVVEEQNERNKVVLEGLSQLWSKSERTERRLDIVERKLVWVDR